MTSDAWEKAAALDAKARNCRDNARAERLVADAFDAEYTAGLSGKPTYNAETYRRTTELYDFVIGGQTRARRYTDDAVLYEAAAAALRSGNSEETGHD